MAAQNAVLQENYNPLFDKMKERFCVQGKYTLAEVMNKRAAHPSPVRERKVKTAAPHAGRYTQLLRRAGMYLSLFVVAVSLVLFAVIGTSGHTVAQTAALPSGEQAADTTTQNTGAGTAEEGGFYSFQSTLNGNLN